MMRSTEVVDHFLGTCYIIKVNIAQICPQYLTFQKIISPDERSVQEILDNWTKFIISKKRFHLIQIWATIKIGI